MWTTKCVFAVKHYLFHLCNAFYSNVKALVTRVETETGRSIGFSQRMSNVILSKIFLLFVRNLSFSQCGKSHKPQRLASSSPANRSEACGGPP